ncbi:hypothetical protein [Shewanella psychrotolerans]|uniref:hypothetical protein n=1 Tax=Shewanella psychrotolerans TaxID=2864206 RepID=UPI001C6605D8|nr:hypothetical protein [Shewanella psychrotolerans]QYK02792.1 hypothetical protein K0I62_07595 [Shewanella psychrotolerans]
MHSISMYSVSVRDRAVRNADNKNGNLELSNLRGKDLLVYLKTFLKDREKDYFKLVDSAGNEINSVFKTTQTTVDDRFISGWVEYGHYGVPGKLINVDNSNNVFKKSKSDSDISHLYYCFYIPKGSHYGVALFHKIGTVGAKSVIEDLFNEDNEFPNWSKGLKLRIKPLTRETDVRNWMRKAQVKKIVLEKFKDKDQFSDVANKLSKDAHMSMTITAPRGDFLGSLFDWNSADYSETVELLEDMCAEVKTEIDVSGKRRMTTLSNQGTESKIDITSADVKMTDNFPRFSSIDTFAKSLAKDLSSSF